VLFAGALLVAGSSCAPPARVATPPASADADLERGIATADSLVEAAVGRQFPGAVLVVAREGKVLHERAFGSAQLYDSGMRRLATPPPMHRSTSFDLASVTKVMATTFAVMLLVDHGLVDVDAPVSRYLPDFRGPQLDSITVRHLLTHSSGLVQWQPLYYHASDKSATYRVIREMPLGWGVGAGRHYSDLGFMVLGSIVERVSGGSPRRLRGPRALSTARAVDYELPAEAPRLHGLRRHRAGERL
jgi:CubicO group peptidase (beta-lactamase class C family)